MRAQSSFPVLFRDIKLACGYNEVFDSFVANVESKIRGNIAVTGPEAQRSARFLADHLALALQGSIMIRYGDARVSICLFYTAGKESFLECCLWYGCFIYCSTSSVCLVQSHVW